MKERILFLFRLYFTYVVSFLLMKPVFMVYNSSASAFSFTDVIQVISHGLIMDCSVSGYLIAFPLLLTILSVWIPLKKWWKRLLTIYAGIVALILAIILITDCALYPFWQFKLDAIALSYIDSLKGAVGSVSAIFAVTGFLTIGILALCLFFLQYRCIPPTLEKTPHRLSTMAALIISGGIAFIGVRGGVGKSNMNVGTVYYSENIFYNHAAVNPAFSLLYSSLKAKNFGKMYRFFPESQSDSIFQTANYSTQSNHTDSLLTTSRPNILLVILEGFGGTFIEHLGGAKNITPHFDRLIGEGIFFSDFYANSFRTDRGLVSILSGYPAFPEISVLQYPEKSQKIGSIGASLNRSGYTTEFIYGGDINFKNIKGYLLSNGYQNALGDTYFPSNVRTTHAWGVTDAIAFDTVYQRITHKPVSQPWFMTFLTLASHEPWTVPFKRNGLDKVANSMAYVDDCIGNFIEHLRQTPQWDNLLVIFLPDHGIGYPQGLTEADIRRYHVPMLWLGGAVKEPKIIDKTCNQTDLAATLLGQLGINHSSFRFSRDVMSQDYHPLAFHTFDNGFAVIDSTGHTVYDLTASKTLTAFPQKSEERINLGKAMLQKYIGDFVSQ